MVLKLRKGTEDLNQTTGFIDPNIQQFTGILGRRGRGKSYLLEVILLMYYELGYLVLDLWGAPTYENYFYCLPKIGLNRDGQPYKKRYPVSILVPETMIINKEEVDNFNNQQQTRVPLVKFYKLPLATAKRDSETNKEIYSMIETAMLDARQEDRIVSFNRKAWYEESTMFRTLEIIFRGISNISYKHLDAKQPSDYGLKTRDEMTPKQKNYHKIAFGAREFGEIAPNRLKGDQSGLSTITKKAQLELFRLARHSSISGVIDYQNASDTESSIRKQIDVWAVKTWNRELAGEQFEWMFDMIDSKRKGLFEQFGYSDESKMYIASKYPRIELLGKEWFYAINSAFIPRIMKVPELVIRHKEPEDKFEKITGISLEHDLELLKKTSGTVKKTSRADDKALFDLMTELKKKFKWKEICLHLAGLQEKGELSSPLQFLTMSENQASSKYSKLRDKFIKKTEIPA